MSDEKTEAEKVHEGVAAKAGLNPNGMSIQDAFLASYTKSLESAVENIAWTSMDDYVIVSDNTLEIEGSYQLKKKIRPKKKVVPQELTSPEILKTLTLDREFQFEMPNFQRFRGYTDTHLNPTDFSDPQERTFIVDEKEVVIPCYKCRIAIRQNANYPQYTYTSKNRMDAYVTMVGSAFLYFTPSEIFLDFYKRSRKTQILPWEIEEYQNKLIYLGPNRCMKLSMDNPVRVNVDYFNAALEPHDLIDAVKRKLY